MNGAILRQWGRLCCTRKQLVSAIPLCLGFCPGFLLGRPRSGGTVNHTLNKPFLLRVAFHQCLITAAEKQRREAGNFPKEPGPGPASANAVSSEVIECLKGPDFIILFIITRGLSLSRIPVAESRRASALALRRCRPEAPLTLPPCLAASPGAGLGWVYLGRL